MKQRVNSQSQRFHSICTALARSGIQWSGARRTKQEWRLLLVSGHAAAEGIPARAMWGLEGEPVIWHESTADMPVGRMASLIDYAVEFCAQHGVTIRNG